MTIWLSNDVVDFMLDEALALTPLETGGILLGWRSGTDRVVVYVRGPGPTALHGRYRFIPDHRWQVAEIERAFSDSGGDIDYLGDWHSHPSGPAAMSGEDIATLARIDGKVPAPIMIILGIEDHENPAINGWLAHSERRFFRRHMHVNEQRISCFDLSALPRRSS